MADKPRVKMTKPQGKTVAEANVLPENVATWEASGWFKAAAAPAAKEGDK